MGEGRRGGEWKSRCLCVFTQRLRLLFYGQFQNEGLQLEYITGLEILNTNLITALELLSWWWTSSWIAGYLLPRSLHVLMTVYTLYAILPSEYLDEKMLILSTLGCV